MEFFKIVGPIGHPLGIQLGTFGGFFGIDFGGVFWQAPKTTKFRKYVGRRQGRGLSGDTGSGDGRLSLEDPSPIPHAPRDSISRKRNPSLRFGHILW